MKITTYKLNDKGVYSQVLDNGKYLSFLDAIAYLVKLILRKTDSRCSIMSRTIFVITLPSENKQYRFFSAPPEIKALTKAGHIMHDLKTFLNENTNFKTKIFSIYPDLPMLLTSFKNYILCCVMITLNYRPEMLVDTLKLLVQKDLDVALSIIGLAKDGNLTISEAKLVFDEELSE